MPYRAEKIIIINPSRVPLMMYNCGVLPLASSIAPKIVSGPTQNKSVAVTKPVTNLLSLSGFENLRRRTSPRLSSRSSIRNISPIIAPSTMPTSGNTILSVLITSRKPSAIVTNPITCTIIVRIRSGMRLPIISPSPPPAKTVAVFIKVPSPRIKIN